MIDAPHFGTLAPDAGVAAVVVTLARSSRWSCSMLDVMRGQR